MDLKLRSATYELQLFFFFLSVFWVLLFVFTLYNQHLEEKLWQTDKPRQHIKKQDITLRTKVRIVKAMVFPGVRYGCESWTINKVKHQRTDAFKLWCWRRLHGVLASPMDCKEIKPVNPNGTQPWILIGRTDTEAETQYFGHLMQRADSFEKTLMLGKIEGRRRRGQQGWDGCMASWTQWTWVCVDFGSWWWTGRAGVLSFMG